MREPIYIREMELEDLAEVFAMGERLFTAEKWPALYRTWDDYELASLYAADGDYCLVAERERDEKLVGFILGTVVAKRRTAWTYGWVIWLGVDPALKRQGVARRLLDRLTEIFIEDGARMLIVDTDAENSAALRFFERQGFGQSLDHVYLSRNLTGHPKYKRKAGPPPKKPPRQRTGAKPRDGGAKGRVATPDRED